MKIVINQQQLNTALSFLQKAIPAKPQLPILSSVFVKTTEDSLELSATDLFFGVKTKVPLVSLQTPGDGVIPGKLFKETINSLGTGELSLEQKETTLLIKTKNTKTSLQCHNGEEYPPFPTVEGFSFKMSKNHIVAVEKLVSFATSNDVARPVLTALLFRLDQNGATIVATDGFRLATIFFSDITTEEPQEFLVPSNAFAEVSRIMHGVNEETAEFVVSKELKQAFCRFPTVEVFIRLVEGAYPPFERIVPTVFTTEVMLSVEELSEQVKRSMIFARDSSNIISLQFAPEQTTIKASSPSFGTYEGELLEAKTTGEATEISFNAKYILDFVQSVKTGTIWFGMNDSLKPAMFKHTEVPEYQYVVMPFKVNT